MRIKDNGTDEKQCGKERAAHICAFAMPGIPMFVLDGLKTQASAYGAHTPDNNKGYPADLLIPFQDVIKNKGVER